MHLSASHAAVEFHDIGFKFQTGNVQCCIDCTCCISSRGAPVSIPTEDGNEIDVPGNTVLVFDNGALRQFQPLKDKKKTETLFKRTLSGYYDFLANKYTAELVTIVFATRGVDFVKKYRKAKALRLSEIQIIKQGIEDIMPYRYTLAWIIKNIHETAQDILSGDFIATTPTIQKLQKRLQQTGDQGHLEPSEGSEKDDPAARKHKMRRHFLEIAQARGIFAVSDIPTFSDKLKVLRKDSGSQKKLSKLASKGQSIFLRNTEGDKLIRAAKTVYRMFRNEYPKFVRKGINEPTVDDLQNLLESFSQLALQSKNDTTKNDSAKIQKTEPPETAISDSENNNTSKRKTPRRKRPSHRIDENNNTRSHGRRKSKGPGKTGRPPSLQATATSHEVLATASNEDEIIHHEE